ncbi:MAG: DUF547 domain-containing protein [Nitrospinae bacterium CG11_big_fil_rev_8_21_14_0_20_56_8]|nr:MAG: DUF547 domain-containing protein [Nitrospinae bacterium CG11_big_fil_rev_8_21_14_0_20_56_8]
MFFTQSIHPARFTGRPFRGLRGRRGFGLLLAGLVFILASSPVAAFDFTDWDGMLKRYVSERTLDGVRLSAVDYRKVKADPAFSHLVERLKSADVAQLKSREDKLAFWINVYNILAVKMILDNYPLQSIKDAGSLFSPVWDKPAGEVAGVGRTLAEVEHGILRKMGEPRIHVAIVCASVSCPDLAREAYLPEKLGDQLDRQMRAFLREPGKGMRLDAAGRRVFLSSIFKWFEDDFEAKGGVLPFLRPYVSPEERKLLNDPEIRVSYLDYNWNVNER